MNFMVIHNKGKIFEFLSNLAQKWNELLACYVFILNFPLNYLGIAHSNYKIDFFQISIFLVHEGTFASSVFTCNFPIEELVNKDNFVDIVSI